MRPPTTWTRGWSSWTRLGLAAQIVYPNAGGFAGGGYLSIEDEELRNGCVRTYNDAIAEWQANSNGRLFPQGILPFWNMEEALKETRRCKEELRLVGLTITDTPEKFGIPDYQSSHWDPFWELVSELELPLNFHIGSAGAKGAPLTVRGVSVGVDGPRTEAGGRGHESLRRQRANDLEPPLR